MNLYKLLPIGFTLFFGIHCTLLQAQGFGRNKPKYKKFDFEVYQTDHFDIYHYFENQEVLDLLARQSELWNSYISTLVKDTIDFKNPLVFYAAHGDFQQTNTIHGAIGVTTGGVTEAFKNRVTMPVTFSNQKTSQVLGHELVHAFQYDMIIRGDSTSLQNLSNLPLFMVEGMAEYMTRGRIDPMTSMWMRDVVLQDEIPTVEEMFSPRYFPYRYGQAFWSVMTDKYGDVVMRELLRVTAKYGLKDASKQLLGLDMDGLTKVWQDGLKSHYQPFLTREKEDPNGRKLLSEENAGKMNLSPSLSPNGRYVIFLSEKGIFTTELYLADARTGDVIRKIASTIRDNNFDHLDAFESSGTWSPDSKRYAFVGFAKGRNKLFIKTVDNAKHDNSFFIEGIDAINHPSWSPDGKHILFTGLKDGQPDLFIVNVESEKVTQLTDNLYSELQAEWSAEGDYIVFSTDEVSMRQRPTIGPWYHNLAIFDMATQSVQQLDLFPFSDNMNPQFDKNGNLWFLSDRDGFRNIYSYNLEKDSLYQQTDLMTGVSGISWYSPALSVASKSDRIVYSHYYNGEYTIYGGKEKAFLHRPVQRNQVNKLAGTLPGKLSTVDQVNVGLNSLEDFYATDSMKPSAHAYKPKLTMDAIQGSAGVGMSNGLYGTQAGAAGGVQMLFSDVLGDHNVVGFAAINGELQDAGVGGQYINKKGRIHWGISLAHTPPQRLFIGDNRVYTGKDPGVYELRERVIRIFEDQLSLMASLPINTNLRLEGRLATSYRYYSDKEYTTYIDNVYEVDGQVVDYRIIGSESAKIKHNGEDFTVPVNFGGRNYTYDFRYGFLHQGGIALVGDNSYFGIASPMAGHRFRIGIDHYLGLYDFSAATIDVRKYFWLKPISIGVRGYHYSRFGEDSEAFNPTYIGWQGLVRGLNVRSSEELYDRYGLVFPQLEGSKILMGQMEVRLPFTGPKQISMIKSKFLFTELAAFVDAGVAFDNYGDITYVSGRDEALALGADKSVLFVSTGLSMRINIFGAFILEPYYAIPLRENSKGEFGINFLLPGW